LGGFAIYAILMGIVTLVISLATLRYRSNLDKRGTEPGQGDQLIDMSFSSGGPGGGHGTVIRVTRDPQKYAQAFVPASAKETKDD